MEVSSEEIHAQISRRRGSEGSSLPHLSHLRTGDIDKEGDTGGSRKFSPTLLPPAFLQGCQCGVTWAGLPVVGSHLLHCRMRFVLSCPGRNIAPCLVIQKTVISKVWGQVGEKPPSWPVHQLLHRESLLIPSLEPLATLGCAPNQLAPAQGEGPYQTERNEEMWSAPGWAQQLLKQELESVSVTSLREAGRLGGGNE